MWPLIKDVQAQVDIGKTFVPATQGFTSLGFLVNVLLPNILTFAGVIALVGIVFAGIRFVQHAGAMEGEKAAQSQQAFTAAIIGLVIIFGAYFIIEIVSKITGFNILNPGIN